MTDTDRQPTCAERVQSAWESRRDDLAAMLFPGPDVCSIERDQTGWNFTAGEYWETLISDSELTEANESAEAGLFDSATESIFSDNENEIREAASEAFNEYGLAFDYVAPGTFSDQNEGYWRYQISWGGPSEEIRFYASPGPNTGDFTIYRAEFWYLDWFDGAPVDVTDDPITNLLWEQFHDTGTVDAVMRDALD